MRLFLPALLGAVLFACSSDNPLAERVANLEQELSEVKAAQEEERLSLLARLDALAVTADNVGEIGAVRAKLTQTNVTRSEFTRLANRVAALESQMADWSGVVSSVERSVYAVIYNTWDNDGDFYLSVGTGFAVTSSTLVTNGHVLDALVEYDEWVKAYNQENGTDRKSVWLVVKNLTTNFTYKSNVFSISTSRSHPGWDSDDLKSPDIALMDIQEGNMWPRAPLATNSEAYQLKVGAPIATLGFPGELQGFNDLGALYPIATFKSGTISALRPRFEGRSYTAPRDTYIIQHNLDISGGTSGSPIFDASGRVVAINNSDISYFVDIGDTQARITQTALGFGIRVDKIRELLRQAGVAAKPTTHTNFSELASRLDGREISSLNIVTTREGLAERLAGMKAIRPLLKVLTA